MLLLLLYSGIVAPSPDVLSGERFIRPQLANSSVGSNLLIDNDTTSTVTSRLGPLLPASAVSSDPR